MKTERERENAPTAIYRIPRHVLLHELHDYDRAHRRERRREVDPCSPAATVPVAAIGPRARNSRRTDERTDGRMNARANVAEHAFLQSANYEIRPRSEFRTPRGTYHAMPQTKMNV